MAGVNDIHGDAMKRQAKKAKHEIAGLCGLDD